MNDRVTIAVADGIADVRLNRADKMNAIDPAMFEGIAAAIDRTPEATRQIAHRARSHVQARRPRGQVDSAEQHRVVEVFRTATATGDLQQLMDVLAPDVVLLSDGGGAVSAALAAIIATISASVSPS